LSTSSPATCWARQAGDRSEPARQCAGTGGEDERLLRDVRQLVEPVDQRCDDVGGQLEDVDDSLAGGRDGRERLAAELERGLREGRDLLREVHDGLGGLATPPLGVAGLCQIG
jgi:hypothetical protein